MEDRDEEEGRIGVRKGAVCVRREGFGLGLVAGGVSTAKEFVPSGERSERLGDTLRDGRARVAVADELSDALAFLMVLVRGKSK